MYSRTNYVWHTFSEHVGTPKIHNRLPNNLKKIINYLSNIRGDWMWVTSVSMTTHCGRNIGDPLFQSTLYQKYYKRHSNSILKKMRSYISSIRDRHWGGCHQHWFVPCSYFSSLEIITARVATVFSLPLLLFHFIWNHNSKGKVSPPLRPIVYVEKSLFL